MASASELRTIRWYAETSAWLVGLGDWDSSAQVLSSKISLTKRLRYGALLSLHGFWLSLSAWRLISVFSLKNHARSVDVTYKLLLVLLLVLHMGQAVNNLGIGSTRKGLVALFNELQECYKRSDFRQGAANQGSNSKIFLYASYCLAVASVCTSTVLGVLEATLAWQAMETGGNWRLAVACIAGLVAGGQQLLSCIQFGLLSTYLVMYIRIVNQTLERKWNGAKEEASMERLLAKFHEYRTLAILCNNFNATYCRCVVPGLKLLVSQIAMFCMVIGTRLNFGAGEGAGGLSALSGAMYVTGIYLAITLMVSANMMSSFWAKSVVFIRSFKAVSLLFGRARDEVKQVRTLATALHPLRFAVGSFYYMEREAKLTLASFLVSGTANLLIGFGGPGHHTM